jgi:outer membrane immunogenic protein
MRGRFLFGSGLLAFAAAGAGSAMAADIAARPVGPPPAVAPAFISDWSGFYLGINGGGGWAHTDYEFGINETLGPPGFAPFSFPAAIPPNQSSSGGIFGFQFGHNWQWGPIVGGLELDFDGADIKGTSTFFQPALGAPFFNSAGMLTNEVRIDELASTRGRLGYLIFPNWLLYGTAGIGWGHIRQTTSEATTLTSFLTQTSDTDQFGWVVGAGLEWKFAPNWLLRGEWLHYDFGRHDNSGLFTEFTMTGVDPSNSRTTVDIARAALSYKFSP